MKTFLTLKGWARRFHLLLKIWVVALALVLCAGMFVLWSGPATTAHVEALTEVFELHTQKTQQLRWPLGGYRLRVCTSHGRAAPPDIVPLDADVRLTAAVLARVQRAEGSPDVEIELERDVGDAPEGGAARADKGTALDDASVTCGGAALAELLLADGRIVPLSGPRVVFERRFAANTGLPGADIATVLPLQGRMDLGREIGDGVDRILLSGTVTMHAAMQGDATTWLLKLIHRKTTYVGETLALQRGDHVLPLPAEGSASSAAGYLRIPASGVLQVGFYSPADRVDVQRAGNAAVETELSRWTRLENEPALTLVASAIVALIALLELWGTAAEIHEHTGHTGRRAGDEAASPHHADKGGTS